MTSNANAIALTMLQAGKPVSDIVETTGLTRGQIIAVAESSGVTAAQIRQRGDELLAILAWGEKHPTKAVRAAAARITTGLADLTERRQSEAVVAAAEAELAALRKQLAEAEEKVRRARGTGQTATGQPATKQEREQIRTWANANGHQVAPRGLIARDVLEAWAARTT